MIMKQLTTKLKNTAQRIVMNRAYLGCLAALLVLLIALGTPTPVVHAASFSVNCGNVSGLINAINSANSNGVADTITLSAGCTYTITAFDNVAADGHNGLPVITSPITIQGNGAVIARSNSSGTDPFRIFRVASGGDLTLQDVTVRGGRTTLDTDGGGIANYGTTTLVNSTVTDNQTRNNDSGSAGDGGGIFNSGTLILEASVVSGNFTSNGVPGGFGGGIANRGTLIMEASVVSGNTTGRGSTGGFGGGIANYGTASLTDSTVSGNRTGRGDGTSQGTGFGGYGGGIFSEGTLTLQATTVSGNTTGDGDYTGGIGGGILNRGTATLTNSTISDNTTGNGGVGAGGDGGGVFNNGTLTLVASTLRSNEVGTGGSPTFGGGVANGSGGTLTLTNTIITNSSGGDCSNDGGSITDNGYNLVQDGSCISASTSLSGDPKLLPLADNGGPTQTHTFLPGSPAVDQIPAGVNGCGTTITGDQRGVPRPQNSRCEIGAVENRLQPQIVLTGPAVVNEGEDASFTWTASHDYGYIMEAVETGNECGTAGTNPDVFVTQVVRDSDVGGKVECTFPEGPAMSTISVELRDSHGVEGRAEFVVTINAAPEVVLTGPTTVNEGETASFTWTASDPEGDVMEVVETGDECGQAGTNPNVVVTQEIDGSAVGGEVECTFPLGPTTSMISVLLRDSHGMEGRAEFVVTINNPDDDVDGVSDLIENGAPNNGDGNADGIPDSEQTNVTSLPNARDGGYLTLVAPDGTTLEAVEASMPEQGVRWYNFVEFGLVSFTLDGVDPGGSAEVTILLENQQLSSSYSYYKYGPTPDYQQDHWYSFKLLPGITTTGAEALSDRVVLHFTDGALGDNDLTPNGKIVDPGGLFEVPHAGVYSVNEGDAVQLDVSNPSGEPPPPTLAYAWDFDGDGEYDDATGISPTFSAAGLDGPDSVLVGLQVTDNGEVLVIGKSTITVHNVAPSIQTVNNSGPIDEGSSATVTVDASDPAGAADPLTYAFDCDGDGSYEVTPQAGNSTTCEFADDGSFTVNVQVSDDDEGQAISSTTVTVNNVAPSVDSIMVPIDPVNINSQPVSASASFSDPAGAGDQPYTCTVDYDDGSGPQPGTVSDFTCTGPGHTYIEPGVYQVIVTVTDKDGGSDSDTAVDYIIIYDPSGGFVTGGGWIDSPTDACPPGSICEGATGKATFGFVSKYKKGANVPAGNTEFQFQAGGLNFHSSAYEWLVVNQEGTNAQFKGEGLMNGGLAANGNAYKFMLWATDGSPDTFRIKIWWEDGSSENVVYDNSFDQALGGGSIVVHKGK